MVAWRKWLQLIFIYNSVKTYKILLVFWLESIWLSLVAQMVKNLPTVQEVRSLGWEDLLEKGMATHSSILAWRTPWIEESGGLWFRGSQRIGHNWATNTVNFLCKIKRLNQLTTTLFMIIIQLYTCSFYVSSILKAFFPSHSPRESWLTKAVG